MSLGQRLKKARESKGWSQTLVCKKLKLSNSRLSGYERDYRKPDPDMISILADLYEVSTDWLYGRENPVPDYMQQDNISPFPDGWTKIPIVGDIAAGEPLDRLEHLEGYQFIPKTIVRNREAFALRVKGDSMSGDGIKDGHIVACIKTPEVHPHEIAVVAVRDETATLKRVQQEDDICIMIPSNPDMRPYTVKTKDVHIIGKAVMYTGFL